MGAVFFWCRATADGTPTVDAGLGMGAVDGTRQWAMHGGDEDGSDPSQSATQGSTSHCIVMGDAPNTGTSDVAAFSAFITDGVRVNWNAGSAPGTAWRLMVVLFSSADNAQCEAGTTIGNADAVNVAHTVTLTDMTVEPEFALFGTPDQNGFSSTSTGDCDLAMGFGHGPTASISQASYGCSADDGRTAANRVGGYAADARCIKPARYDATERVAWELTAFGVSGTPRGTFEMTKRDNGTTVSYGYFAVSSEGVNAVHIAAPVLAVDSTGDLDYTAAGFQASALIMLTGELGAVNSNNAGTLAVAQAVCGVDEDEDSEGSYSFYIEETDPDNSNSMFDSQVARILDNNGLDVSWASTFTSFLSNGFRINVGNAAGTGRASPLILIGQPSAAPPTRQRIRVV